jgi:hypothetical protein
MEPINYEDKICQRFNNSLDEEGQITIAGFSAMPSRILFEMDYEAYKQELIDFREQEFEELKNVIYNSFPSCIAYNFRLSEKGEGASDPVRKLLHLKDTWESIVFVLYSLVWGEIRSKSIDLKSCQVFKQYDTLNNPIFESFNSKRLLSDAIKIKIQNIKAIVIFSKANNLSLLSEMISIELLDKLLELQDIRNDISHHAAPTKEQAIEELKVVIPLFQEMLEESRFLEDVRILRFESFSSKCKCEVFNGHSLNKEFEEFDFVSNQSFVIGFGNEKLFVDWNNTVFSLTPFLHYDKDNTGHESYLAFFKGKKEGKYWFEPIKVRTEKSFDHLTSVFESEKDALLNLIVS